MLEIFRQLLDSCTGRATKVSSRNHSGRPALGLETLDDRVLLSATPLHMAIMGDSLSAPYPAPGPSNPPPNYGSAGDLSWVQQLRNLDGNKIKIYDEAFPGATSNSLLNSEAGHAAQAPAVISLIQQHKIDAAVLLIGANDVDQDLPILLANPDPSVFVNTFVSTVVTNVEQAAGAVGAAGRVELVIGNVPDVTVTPGFNYGLLAAGVPAAAIPGVDQVVEYAINLANQDIDAFAASHAVPVVDMYGLTHILNQPATLGGVTVNNLYSPDFFHPNTVGQGILGNAVLDAFHVGYHDNVRELRLSDQQILDEVSIPHQPGRSYFDVNAFVIPSPDTHAHGFEFAQVLEGIEHSI